MNAVGFHLPANRGVSRHLVVACLRRIGLCGLLVLVADPANAQGRSAQASFGVQLTVMPKFNVSNVHRAANGYEVQIETNSRYVDIGGQRVRLDAAGTHVVRLPEAAVIDVAPGVLRIVHAY